MDRETFISTCSIIESAMDELFMHQEVSEFDNTERIIKMVVTVNNVEFQGELVYTGAGQVRRAVSVTDCGVLFSYRDWIIEHPDPAYDPTTELF